MPCYTPKNVNAQRGEGVFDGSIAALQLLNSLGYGIDSELPLHLVYNPVGAFCLGHKMNWKPITNASSSRISASCLTNSIRSPICRLGDSRIFAAQSST